MCLLIASPGQSAIKKNLLRKGYRKNNHGAGFAWAENGEVHIKKGFFDFLDFYDNYIEHTKNHYHPSLIHFRKQSCGMINIENCHPFRVGSMAMGHNGTLVKFKPWADEEISDTNSFAEHLNFYDDIDSLLEINAFCSLVSNFIGLSKLAFLKPSGDFKILNKELGHIYNGSWFSNESYK